MFPALLPPLKMWPGRKHPASTYPAAAGLQSEAGKLASHKYANTNAEYRRQIELYKHDLNQNIQKINSTQKALEQSILAYSQRLREIETRHSNSLININRFPNGSKLVTPRVSVTSFVGTKYPTQKNTVPDPADKVTDRTEGKGPTKRHSSLPKLFFRVKSHSVPGYSTGKDRLPAPHAPVRSGSNVLQLPTIVETENEIVILEKSHISNESSNTVIVEDNRRTHTSTKRKEAFKNQCNKTLGSPRNIRPSLSERISAEYHRETTMSPEADEHRKQSIPVKGPTFTLQNASEAHVNLIKSYQERYYRDSILHSGFDGCETPDGVHDQPVFNVEELKNCRYLRFPSPGMGETNSTII